MKYLDKDGGSIYHLVPKFDHRLSMVRMGRRREGGGGGVGWGVYIRPLGALICACEYLDTAI